MNAFLQLAKATRLVGFSVMQFTIDLNEKNALVRAQTEKFAKMGLQTLAFAVLPLAPHFIGTDGPTVSFTGSGKFTSGQCLQS